MSELLLSCSNHRHVRTRKANDTEYIRPKGDKLHVGYGEADELIQQNGATIQYRRLTAKI